MSSSMDIKPPHLELSFIPKCSTKQSIRLCTCSPLFGTKIYPIPAQDTFEWDHCPNFPFGGICWFPEGSNKNNSHHLRRPDGRCRSKRHRCSCRMDGGLVWLEMVDVQHLLQPNPKQPMYGILIYLHLPNYKPNVGR